MTKIPKIGTLVEVEWRDAAGYTNEYLSKAVPQEAINIGRVRIFKDEYIVLQSGFYPQSEKESDPMGDWTIIPRGWIKKCSVIQTGT